MVKLYYFEVLKKWNWPINSLYQPPSQLTHDQVSIWIELNYTLNKKGIWLAVQPVELGVLSDF